MHPTTATNRPRENKQDVFGLGWALHATAASLYSTQSRKDPLILLFFILRLTSRYKSSPYSIPHKMQTSDDVATATTQHRFAPISLLFPFFPTGEPPLIITLPQIFFLWEVPLTSVAKCKLLEPNWYEYFPNNN